MLNMNIQIRTSDRTLNSFPLIAHAYKKIWWAIGHKWIHKSGSRWTLDRMKQLVTHLIQVRAGNNPTITWWSKSLLNYPVQIAHHGSDSKFIQLIQLLRSWTLFAGQRITLTDEDVQDFRDKVERVDISNIIDDPMLSLRKQRNKKGSYSSRTINMFPEGRLSGSPTFIQPITFTAEAMHPAMEAIEYVEMNGASLPKKLVRYRIDPDESHGTTWPFGYVDHKIQTDGKIRWFYAAPRWQNEMFSEYSRNLYSHLRSINEDCTFNQDKGVRKVQEWLKEDIECFSIDLSAATDAFPWSITKSAIVHMAGYSDRWTWTNFVQLYEELVIKPGAMIRTPVSVDFTHVTWTKGQPLGAQASFAMFALSHHYVVRRLFYNLGLSWVDQYVILGDDIVIRNPEVAANYRKLMHHYGVEISEAKSVSSSRVGEFAGRVILKEDMGFKTKAFHVIPENLHSAISILGARAVRSCRNSFARNVMALIPQRGYDGTNPGGFPFDQVVEFYKYLFTRETDPDIDVSDDMYATRAQVSSRHALDIWNKPWNPNTIAKAIPSHRFHDDPVTGIVWKWKPFLKRKVYSDIIRVARTIFKD